MKELRKEAQKKVNQILRHTTVGVEIEMTGITREDAAEITQTVIGGRVEYLGTYYRKWACVAEDGRKWVFTYDSSIECRKMENGRKVWANDEYACEFNSPILRYEEDIELLQEVVRALRKNGAFITSNSGIHVHCGGNGHNARSLKNLCNIIYSKGNLLYKSIQFDPEREHWAKLFDEELCESLKKAKTVDDVKETWYDTLGGYRNESDHYNESRYHFLNLHSFFHGHGTVEFRGFNSTLHAGKVRSYLLLCLAINYASLTQRCASIKKPQMENVRFACAAWLQQMGMVGEEFKTARNVLIHHLEGNQAYRH